MVSTQNSSFTRGDDSAAFGRKFMKIKVTNKTLHTISRAEWHCGKVIIDLGENPEFPYYLQVTKDISKQFQNKNECYLICWDENGNKYTCPQKGTFTTNPER